MVSKNVSDSKGASAQTILDNDLIRFEDLVFENLDAYLVSKEQLLVRRLLMERQPVIKI